MISYLNSLAVGVMQVGVNATPAQRTDKRIALALAAAARGYALVQAYETDGDGVTEDAAFRAVEELAVKLNAQALVFSGTADLSRVHDVADRIRLVVVSA